MKEAWLALLYIENRSHLLPVYKDRKMHEKREDEAEEYNIGETGKRKALPSAPRFFFKFPVPF